MKTKIIFGGLIAVLLIFLAWFAVGGGFKTVEVYKEPVYELTIFGEIFEGALGSKEASVYFTGIEERLQGKPMYVVYDGQPTKKNNYSTKLVAGSVENLEGGQSYKLSFKKVYRARHDAYVLFNKAQTSVYNAAKEDEVDLDLTKMIEVYHTKNDVEVIIPEQAKPAE